MRTPRTSPNKRYGNVLLSFIRQLAHLNRRTRLIIICGAGALLLAVVLLVVFLSLPGDGGVKQASAGGLPVPTGTPEAAATLPPLPTPSFEPVATTDPDIAKDPTLKKGDENNEVADLQQRLMDLGYLDIDETTQKFGSATEMAVKWFQRQAGMEQTGVADGVTLLAIFSEDAKPYTLLKETSGSDVDSLQRQLKSLGYLNKVTGYYGTETVDAVKKFQTRNNLTADGKTGEHTLDLIYSPDAKPDPSVAEQIRSKANVEEMISVAAKQLGKPYVGGNEGPKSFDCSGLVYYCLHQAGSNRGRYNAAGYSKVEDWKKITKMSDLKRGDLMFFWSSPKHKIGHVSIYIGDGMMIDASSKNGKVVKRSAFSNWCKDEFRWGRRPW